MVDPIGAKAAAARAIAVARVAPVASVAGNQAARGTAAPVDTAALTGTAKALSATPPVDVERVARVRKAIADGKFPILPTTIADNMIAYKLEWMKNDQA